MNGNRGFFGFGGGANTIQNITNKDTIIGIVLFAAVMVTQRVLFWLIFFLLVLMAGEQAGAILALSVAIFLYDAVRMGRSKEGKMVLPALLLAALLLMVAAFDYWPTLLQWQRVESQMHYRVTWTFTRWWSSWLSFDTNWQPMTWAVAWLRIFAVVVVPAIVWTPGKLSDWALGIEIFAPLLRETRYAQADPSAAPMPDGYQMKQSHQAQENDPSPPMSSPIPQPRSRGS